MWCKSVLGWRDIKKIQTAEKLNVDHMSFSSSHLIVVSHLLRLTIVITLLIKTAFQSFFCFVFILMAELQVWDHTSTFYSIWVLFYFKASCFKLLEKFQSLLGMELFWSIPSAPTLPASEMKSLKENLKHSGEELERSEPTEPLQLLGSNLKPPSSHSQRKACWAALWAMLMILWASNGGNLKKFMLRFRANESTCSSEGNHSLF